MTKQAEQNQPAKFVDQPQIELAKQADTKVGDTAGASRPVNKRGEDAKAIAAPEPDTSAKYLVLTNYQQNGSVEIAYDTVASGKDLEALGLNIKAELEAVRIRPLTLR